jgi:hypothetical protein
VSEVKGVGEGAGTDAGNGIDMTVGDGDNTGAEDSVDDNADDADEDAALICE